MPLVIPIRYIIMARRINYLHYLANLKENELLNNFFMAQVKTPQKGDWILTVMENVEHLGLDVDIDILNGMNQEKFKKNVKHAVYKAAFNYLLSKARGHSKMEKLHYEEDKKYELQSYFKSEKLTKNEVQLYFRFRTRMEDFSENFKNGAIETTCSLCLKQDSQLIFSDSQQHFLICKVVIDKVPKIVHLLEKEIYSVNNVNIEAVKVLVKAIEARKLLLDNLNNC